MRQPQAEANCVAARWNPLDTAAKTLAVAVRGDTIDEPNETFTVELSLPQNATLARSAGTGTTLDDDGL